MVTPPKKIAIIAFGANAGGDSAKNATFVQNAYDHLIRSKLKPVAFSPFFRTPAYPAGAGPDFINAVGLFEWEATAPQLLNLLHKIEKDLGRQRKKRWEQRLIDLDLLDLGGQILPSKAGYEYWQKMELKQQFKKEPAELILPHPRLQDRGFVLLPLAAVAPDWIHPVLGKSAMALLAALPAKDLASIVQYDRVDGLASCSR